LLIICNLAEAVDITVVEALFCAFHAKVYVQPAFTPAEIGAREAEVSARAKKYLGK